MCPYKLTNSSELMLLEVQIDVFVQPGGNVLNPLTVAGELCCPPCQRAAGPLLGKQHAAETRQDVSCSSQGSRFYVAWSSSSE